VMERRRWERGRRAIEVMEWRRWEAHRIGRLMMGGTSDRSGGDERRAGSEGR
jgi:hypothetical protein